MDENLERVLLMGGIIAPLLLAVGILVASAIYPGYNHATQFISEISAAGAPAAWIMNAVLIICGCLIVGFGFAIHSKLSADSFFGPLLLIIAGITMALSGVFVCDAACANQTILNSVHNILARVLVVAFVLGVLFTAPLFKNTALFIYSIATVILIAIFGVGLLVSLYSTEFSGFAAAIETTPLAFLTAMQNGIMQRIVTGLPLLWTLLVAFYLRRK